MNTLNTSTPFRRLIAATVLTSLAAGMSSVCAAAAWEVPQLTVKYSDLNVSNPQGAAQLYTRINMAAHRVCEPLHTGSLSSLSKVKACMARAISEAVAKVDQPQLTAIYNAKNGIAPATLVATSNAR